MTPYEPHDPASKIQDYLVFGEFGDVNPSITDSSTYTFMDPGTMKELFEHEIEGCFLYSRHWNPSDCYLSRALAAMEDTPSAHATASGMSAIACAVMNLCSAGDEIVSARTVYGGTYALFKHLLPRFGVTTQFVDMDDLDQVRAAVTPKSKVIYTESLSNPLLSVADLPALAQLANDAGAKLVVDNTFSPMLITPHRHGAHVVVHSLTKFINGTSDCVAGCICADEEFVADLMDVNSGSVMLLGPVLDSIRAASILKNLHSLHIRMQQHGRNAMTLASKLNAEGYKVHYPGLPSHRHHERMAHLMNAGYGYGGMLALDVETEERANRLMRRLQEEMVGYLAVSLGYFKTLFSAPGESTSSEIPPEEREAMGLSDGLVRMSIGLDQDIERTCGRVVACLRELGVAVR